MIEYRYASERQNLGGANVTSSAIDIGERKILIIDDEHIIRGSVRAYLEDLDYQILEASNGLEGVSLIETEEPDLVLLDLQMPEMGGLEVLSRIQSSASILPVIVISGGGVIDDVVEALRLGAWDYLTKPIPDLAVLHHAMTKALERAELIEEHNIYQANLEHEIAERKLVEQSLRESERRFKDMVDSSSDWIWEMDADFRFTYLSQQFFDISGFMESDVIGKTREQSSRSYDKDRDCINIKELTAQLKQYQTFKMFEYETRRADGSRMIVQVSGKPVFTEQNEFVGYRGTGFDVSRLRDAQEQLQYSEKMAALGSLVAGVAHEVNTPVGIGVTAISHIADRVRTFERAYGNGDASAEDLEEFLQDAGEGCNVVMSNLERAAGLIQSFKQVAVDQSSESRRVFDLKEYIDEILLSLHPRLKKTSHKVSITCSDEIDMDSYPGAISQVLTNLVMNSLIHGFKGVNEGFIQLEITSCEGRVNLEYSDSGVGMGKEQLEHLFEPFYTTTRSTGGTGLGMNVVFNLVKETLGGSIDCQSGKEKGTRYTINIPSKR